MMYSHFCTWCGHHDHALQQAQIATELELLDPMTNFHLVKNSYYARQYQQAVEKGRAAIELTRDFPGTLEVSPDGSKIIVSVGDFDNGFDLWSLENFVPPVPKSELSGVVSNSSKLP
jgi:hypothetical protein